MRNTVKKVIQYVVLLVLGGGLIYLSFQNTQVSWRELFTVFQSTSIGWVIASVIISFFSHFIRAYRWNYLLENYSYQTDIWTSNAAVFIGYLANYGLPRMGELSRCAVVSKYNKIPLDIALGTVIAERAVDFLLMFILFILVVLFQYNDLQALLNKYILDPVSDKISLSHLIMLLMGVLGLILVFHFINKSRRQKKQENRFSLWSKIFRVIQNLIGPLWHIHKIKKPLAFWTMSIIIWLLYFLSMYFCALSMSDLKSIHFLNIMVLFLFGTIGVIVTPGGIGAYHFLMTELLIFYGIQKAPAVAFPWLVWGTQFVMIVLLGGLSFILLPIIHSNYKNNG